MMPNPIKQGKKIFCSYYLQLLFAIFIVSGCNSDQSKNKKVSSLTIPKLEAYTLKFVANKIDYPGNAERIEIDTVTKYHKYFSHGKIQAEGKISESGIKKFRDSVWRYYNEAGQLMKVETYNSEGKINSRTFTYFTNNKPMSETYEYFEGDYKDKRSFKFHKIEVLFYTNGQALSERHSINDEVVETKCWDSKGNPKSLDYLETIKSLEANE